MVECNGMVVRGSLLMGPKDREACSEYDTPVSVVVLTSRPGDERMMVIAAVAGLVCKMEGVDREIANLSNAAVGNFCTTSCLDPCDSGGSGCLKWT
jgi:tetrahydromethanopterin S-methyltransferase subunit A